MFECTGQAQTRQYNFSYTYKISVRVTKDNYTSVKCFIIPLLSFLDQSEFENFTLIKHVSHLSQYGSIWLARMHTWHKLDNTLAFVDIKFNPRQASDRYHINKKHRNYLILSPR